MKDHWQQVYGTKPVTEVSWYEPEPHRSLEMIRATGVAPDAPVIDIGGGASTLVDRLLAEGYTDLSVLDVSATALAHSRRRLGEKAGSVQWIVSDILEFSPRRRYALWHDRAALHFLTEERSLSRYRAVLLESLAPGGHLVVATFGPQGPTRCSGLAIRRYDAKKLGKLLGPRFRLCAQALHRHATPMGTDQQFLYTRWQLGKASEPASVR